jgi:hypothetical protein
VYQVSAQLLEKHALSVEAETRWISGVEVKAERQNQRLDICLGKDFFVYIIQVNELYMVEGRIHILRHIEFSIFRAIAMSVEFLVGNFMTEDRRFLKNFSTSDATCESLQELFRVKLKL